LTPIFFDTETFSTVEIKTRGTYKYVEHAKIIMWQYAIGDGEVVVLDDDDIRVNLIKNLLKDPNYEIVIHNSNFDRTILKHCAGIDLPTSRIFDTMACAMAHSLPGALEQLCAILNISGDKSKDKDGKKLIQLFCKPTKDGNEYTKHTHPTEWQRFREYGRLDIVAMREIYRSLPRWNFKGAERRLWELDQKINDKGVFVDHALASAAIRASSRAKKAYDAETFERTRGQVTTTNRRDALLAHILSEYGIVLEDLTAARVRAILEKCELPHELLELLQIRLDASKTSTSKYRQVLNCVSADGRLRGLLKFCGASRTGRWAGSKFQPQNLPRPTLKAEALERFIEEIKCEAEGVI
jgi:DNA polymerase